MAESALALALQALLIECERSASSILDELSQRYQVIDLSDDQVAFLASAPRARILVTLDRGAGTTAAVVSGLSIHFDPARTAGDGLGEPASTSVSELVAAMNAGEFKAELDRAVGYDPELSV